MKRFIQNRENGKEKTLKTSMSTTILNQRNMENIHKNKTKKQIVSRTRIKTADLKIENMFSMELIHTTDQKMDAIIWCNIPA